MPLYEFFHITPLSTEQRDALASGVTQIHSEKFTTPRLFVNVVFNDVTDVHTYVAGKRHRSNRLNANVRHGPSRTQAMYDDLCAEINALWGSTVGTKGDLELRAIFVLGSIVAGSEAGLSVPQAGKDKEWLAENMKAFQKKAAEGDGDFKEMLEEVERRGLTKGVANGH